MIYHRSKEHTEGKIDGTFQELSKIKYHNFVCFFSCESQELTDVCDNKNIAGK